MWLLWFVYKWYYYMLALTLLTIYPLRVLGYSVGGADVVADLAVTGLSRVPVLVGVALISLAYSSCGTLALSLAGVFYFLKVREATFNYDFSPTVVYTFMCLVRE